MSNNESTAGHVAGELPYTVEYWTETAGGFWARWGVASTRDAAETMAKMAAKAQGKARILEQRCILEIEG